MLLGLRMVFGEAVVCWRSCEMEASGRCLFDVCSRVRADHVLSG